MTTRQRAVRMWILAGVVSGTVTLALAGITLATPASGVTSVNLSRATLNEPIGPSMYNVDGVLIKTKGPVDIVTQLVTFNANGGTAGWHGHAGAVLVSVTAGTLTTYDEHCVMATYGPGDAFFEPGPHHARLVRNEGTVDVTVYATWIVPVGANPLRLDAADPGCGVGG
jgi:hypothetical protein